MLSCKTGFRCSRGMERRREICEVSAVLVAEGVSLLVALWNCGVQRSDFDLRRCMRTNGSGSFKLYYIYYISAKLVMSRGDLITMS